MEAALKDAQETQLLSRLASVDPGQYVQEVEWDSTKLRSVDFRDLLHQRAAALDRLLSLAHVEADERFEELVS